MKNKPCTFCYSGVLDATHPAEGGEVNTGRLNIMWMHVLNGKLPSLVPYGRNIMGKIQSGTSGRGGNSGGKKAEDKKQSNLEPGEWVVVKSESEIRATLDIKGRSKGLRFMPEMRRFCGEKHRVFKRVDKIMLESTGEMRALKNPSFFLEGVFCDGEFHEGCERSCFLFWREEWLEKVEP